MSQPTNNASSAARPHQSESVKDTLISIVIAFTLAFVFRGFVIEAFVIPTGSMAPTLMGAHMQFRGPSTGYSWPVGPWDNQPYSAMQSGPNGTAVVVHDPISGEEVIQPNVPLRSGDRILVLKYLYTLMEPSRYDVVVFKNPTDPSQNYIKRLIGLPGEEIALVDGDVFTRPASHGPDDPGKSLWAQAGWHIARKEHTEQMAVWQTVFDSGYAPPDGAALNSPWNTDDKGAWDFGPNVYTCKATTRTELFFDRTKRRFAGRTPYSRQRYETWSIDDRYAYDEGPAGDFQRGSAQFPVSDVRMRLGIEPTDGSAGPRVEALIRARGMDFQASINGTTAALAWREHAGEAGVLGKWENLATAQIAPLRAGRVTDVEFWHSDQSLKLYIDGVLVARHDYDWSPAERIAAATGRDLGRIMAEKSGSPNPLADDTLYRAPDIRWSFSGAPFRLHRVGIDRDLHYQPRPATDGKGPALATSPSAPLVLNGNQFFCCGDNSPQSLDGRLWGKPEPWVAYEFDNAPGVVPRDLMLGKAFFVYWPAPHWRAVPIPDFGKMRFIR